jgi:hypothetical protein
MKRAAFIVVLLLTVACTKTPPALTPEATIAFKGTQAVKALDILRDTAVAANAQVPPLLTEDVTRKVVLYHQSTVRMIQTSQAGWKAVAQTGLDEVVNNLSPPNRELLAPYVALIRTVLAEVTK